MAQPNGNLVPQSGLLPLSSGAKGFQLSGNGGAFPISSPAPVVGKSNLTPNGNGGFNLPSGSMTGVAGNSAPNVTNGGFVQTPQPVVSQGGNTSAGTSQPTTAQLQATLDADKAQLASLQAQQAALNQPATTGDTTAKVTYPGLVSTLGQTASQPSAQYTTAENNANATQAQLQQLQSAQAQQDALIGGSRTDVSEAQGEAGLYNTQMIGQENAAATALAGYQNQAGIATGQQSAQQSGLAAAGALAAPQAANTLGTYNPLDPTQYTQYGDGTGSGAATAGAVGEQVTQGAAVQNMTGIMSQAQALTPQLTTAISESGYNPAQGLGAATTYANGVNQWLQNASGSPQYKNAANLIGEIANKYSAILSQSGGTPTSVSQVQQQIIGGLASGKDIETIIGDLQNNAQKSIDALNATSKSNATSGSGSSVTAGGNSYVHAQGQWVPQ